MNANEFIDLFGGLGAGGLKYRIIGGTVRLVQSAVIGANMRILVGVLGGVAKVDVVYLSNMKYTTQAMYEFKTSCLTAKRRAWRERFGKVCKQNKVINAKNTSYSELAVKKRCRFELEVEEAQSRVVSARVSFSNAAKLLIN